MSNIDDLTTKVRSLRDQLDCAESKLKSALVESEPLKVGDVVRVTRKVLWPRDAEPVVMEGRVKEVIAKRDWKGAYYVMVLMSKRTMSGKWHASQTFQRLSGDTVEVIEDIKNAQPSQ